MIAEPTVSEPTVPSETSSELFASEGGIVVPRVLGRIGMDLSGPTLVCVGGIHGNEPAGVLGLRRVLARLEADPRGLRGRFIALAGNRRALARRRRYLVHDLNRHWTTARVARLRQQTGPLEAEDAELRELDTELRAAFASAPAEVVCFDLHTVSGPGHCFLTLDDALVNRELAVHFPTPIVLGLEEELEGTLTFHLTANNVRNLGFESGQHDDPVAVDRAEDAIWVALEVAGVLEPGSHPEVAAARARLRADAEGFPHVVEIRHRHAIAEGDVFRMLPGFVGLQPVERGQLLARDRHREIRSPFTGLILMPLYQEQGDDGFFLVRPVRPVWLRLSAFLRRGHAERFMHWLPGVRRHAELPGTFVVDQRWARFLAPQIFHLLGFRRTGKPGRFLTMTRRADYRE